MLRHEDMKDLHCMAFTSKGTSEILVAGSQDAMFVIDVNKGEVVKQVRSSSSPYTMMPRTLLTVPGLYGPSLYHYEKEPVYMRCDEKRPRRHA